MVITKYTTDGQLREAISKNEKLTTPLTKEELNKQFGGFALSISSEVLSIKNLVAMIYGQPVYTN